MNIGYVLAVAILDGEVLPEQFSPARLDADDVWGLIPRITAHHNPDFDNDPNDRGKTILRIRFTDGQVLESVQQAARSVLSGVTNEEITAEYRQLAQDVLDPDRAAPTRRTRALNRRSPETARTRAGARRPRHLTLRGHRPGRGCVTIPRSDRPANPQRPEEDCWLLFAKLRTVVGAWSRFKSSSSRSGALVAETQRRGNRHSLFHSPESGAPVGTGVCGRACKSSKLAGPGSPRLGRFDSFAASFRLRWPTIQPVA